MLSGAVQVVVVLSACEVALTLSLCALGCINPSAVMLGVCRVLGLCAMVDRRHVGVPLRLGAWVASVAACARMIVYSLDECGLATRALGVARVVVALCGAIAEAELVREVWRANEVSVHTE